MADVTQYTFKHQEVVTALIKQQGINEGLWGLTISFGFAALNIGPMEASSPGAGLSPKGDLNPGAVSIVTSVGLQRATEESNLTVNAATVNPAPKTKQK
jgi:hypothetical protein